MYSEYISSPATHLSLHFLSLRICHIIKYFVLYQYAIVMAHFHREKCVFMYIVNYTTLHLNRSGSETLVNL